MIQRFKKLLVARQATGVIHDHGFPHGEGQKQHGRDGGDDAGPAQTHVIGVGLVAGGEAAACVSGEQDRADGKSGKEGRLGDFGVGFHDFFLLQMLSDGWQEKQKTFRRSCRLAEETKGRNPPRYHSSLFPVLETHSTGYHHIPATVTGAPVCIYFQFDAAAVQPVRQLDRAVPRTNRHFSERIALLTTLCHCVFVGCIIAR